jgi:hypothetical protein
MGMGNPMFGSANWNMGMERFPGYNQYGIMTTKPQRPNLAMQNREQPSQTVLDMIARANAAAQNVNTPTLASLFPSMSFGQSQTPMMGGGQLAGGQFGAGRFLGQNASQFGNPAMPMGGFAPNTNNTTT